MKRDSMIIYREWKEALQGLNLEERCKAWEAIMDYAFDGTVPADKFLNVVTAMMRKRIDKDQEIYKDTCNKRAAAGRLGGLKSAITRSKKKCEANASFASSNEANSSNLKQTQAKQADNDNEYDNDIISSKEDDNIDLLLRIDNIIKNCIQLNPITIECFCKTENIDLELFKTYAQKVLLSWYSGNYDLEEIQKNNEEYGLRHLFNTIKYQKQFNKSAPNEQDKLQRRRSTDSETWTTRDFEETF